MKTLLQALLLITYSFSLFARTEFIQGEAKSRDGELKYKEQHIMTYEGDDLKKVETQYFKPSGENFASLTSEFNSSPLLPDSLFKDLRNNKSELTKVEAKQYVVTTNNGKDVIKTGKLDIESNLLCGQGYHNFIRANLNNFKKDEIREIKFVLPSRRDYFSFDLSLIKEEGNIKTFKLAITNWVLKMFADSIEVDYDTKGNLLAYRGLSNIQDENGDNMDVLITLTKVDSFK